MTKKNPDNFDLGDILRASLSNPLDAIVQASGNEPAIEEQVRDPTPEEMDAIEKLGQEAAQLQDELRDLVGDRQRRLTAMKAQLKDQMLQHGLRKVDVAGRPPIELSESKDRKPTRKAIIAVLQKEHGEKEGKAKGMALWDKIDPTVSYSLSIPDAAPADEEGPQ